MTLGRGNAPLVSVVMPVRDGARFLAEAVDSVLRQSFGDFELVTVDDGSTDATPRLLHDYAARDARVRLVRQGAGGVARALNAGMRAARGAYVARMDADDVAEPGRLAREVAVLDRDPRCVLVGTAALCIDDSGRVLRTVTPPTDHDAIAAALRDANVFIHGTVMVRRTAWEAAGGYDEHARARHVEDYDLWCRLLAHGRLVNLGEPLYRLRVHAGSVSAQAVDTQLEGVYGVRARYFGTPRPAWAARRTARADRHLGYARTFAADGHLAAAAWHLVAAWRAKPWSPTVVRYTLRAVAGRGAASSR